MPDKATVLLDVRDGVAQLTLNRPDSGNAFDLPQAQALERALQAVAADDSACAVLLKSTGKLFCAGGDLNAMHAASDRGAYVRKLVDAVHTAVRLLAALPKPVVAAVHGPTAGAGLSMLLLSDIVIASSKATFTTAYTAVGLTPDCGQSWLLPRVVGLSRALDLTLLPRRIGAEEARAMGIVSRVVDADAVAAEAQSVAERLANGPAGALGAARSLLRTAYAEGFAAHLDLEADTIVQRAATAEADASMGAFLASKA